MPLYLLDQYFRRETMVQAFQSLLWTERFDESGDFELVILSTPSTRDMYTENRWLGYSESKRVMRIETVEDTTDDDGRRVLNVTGRSLETILQDRVARPNWNNTNTTAKWVITDTPANILRRIFQLICVDGVLSASDKIPLITAGNPYPQDTIPESMDSVTIELEPATLFEVARNICQLYGLGFRLIKSDDTSQLYFNVYTGSNRTSSQQTVNPIIFSPDLDSLENISELNSSAALKNVAYVMAPTATQEVYLDDFSTRPTGLDRRVLLVSANPGNITGQALTDFLKKAGRDALSEYRRVSAFDGKIGQNGTNRYDVDYYLGDIVEMRNRDGFIKNMRVTEQIFVEDGEGIRQYPTLTDMFYITPGSWYDWAYSREWQNFEGTWADQPGPA